MEIYNTSGHAPLGEGCTLGAIRDIPLENSSGGLVHVENWPSHSAADKHLWHFFQVKQLQFSIFVSTLLYLALLILYNVCVHVCGCVPVCPVVKEKPWTDTHTTY